MAPHNTVSMLIAPFGRSARRTVLGRCLQDVVANDRMVGQATCFCIGASQKTVQANLARSLSDFLHPNNTNLGRERVQGALRRSATISGVGIWPALNFAAALFRQILHRCLFRREFDGVDISVPVARALDPDLQLSKTVGL